MHLDRKSSDTKKGFTLIELMVSSAIFIIVMVIAIGAVLSIVDANRKAQSLNTVMTNLNFAVESMVRDINTGSNYCGGNTCSASSLSFTNSHGQSVTYSFNKPTGQNGQIIKTLNGVSAPLTAPETNITSMSFYERGQAVGDGIQPVVLLYLEGKVGISAKTTSDFKLQTLISQRKLDS